MRAATVSASPVVPTESPAAVVLGHNALVLLGLSGLALAQPLLDLFGKNPEFFVAKDASGGDVVRFGLAVTFLVPAVLIALEVVAYSVARPVVPALHTAFVGALGAALGLTIVRQLSLDAMLVVMALAIGAGVAMAVGERRWHGLRMALRLLALSPLVFLGFYLGLSSSSRLIWGSEAQVATDVEVGSDSPVVEIVLDEFPLASILSPEGTINAARFPGFARLAAGSSWFRNASSVSWQTEHSVPSILTGDLPRANEIATSMDHPRNLFTLLGGSYRMHVSEQITELCPSSICVQSGLAARASSPPGLAASLLDAAVVYGHATLPSAIRSHLPSIGHSWGGFVADAGGSAASVVAVDPAAIPAGGSDGDSGNEFAAFARWRALGVGGQAPPAQGAILEDLIDSASKPGDGRLSFAHVVLPHFPWQMTPSGHRYSSRADLPSFTERTVWPDDEFVVRQAQQEHLLQVGYVDALIGELIDRMQAAGTWDDALVVVVADHGASFRPGGPPRVPTDQNVDDIYRIPYFVKAPGQSAAEVRDDNARLIDVLPTMVDVLDLETDWEFDGRSLFGDTPPPEDKEVVGNLGPTSIPVSTEGLLKVVALNERRFGRDAGWRGVLAVGPYGDAVGSNLSDLPATGASALEWSIDQEEALATVDLSSGFVPILVSGRMDLPPGEHLPRSVLVVVNGTVAGVGGDFHRSGGHYTFTALLGEWLIQDGANTVDLLVPHGDVSRPRYAVATHVDQPTYELHRHRLVPTDRGGRPLPVTAPSDERRLEVESAFEDLQTLAVKGWAADLETAALPDAVLVFADGEQVGVASPRRRFDLDPALGDGGTEAGFEEVVRAGAAPRGAAIEVVAVFGDRAIRVGVTPDR